ALGKPAAQPERQDRPKDAGAGNAGIVREMSGAKPVHAPMTQFPVVADCVQVGGVSLVELAERVGRTPFYAYDRGVITRRIELLRKYVPADVHLHYAMKANPMPAVVKHIAPLVDGLDVASEGELRVALAACAKASTISFAGPGKTDADLAAAVAASIVVNLESEREMERIAAIGRDRGLRPLVAVRVNPDFELKSSGMKMG